MIRGLLVAYGKMFWRKSLIKNGQGPEMLWIHGAHGGHGFFIHGGQEFLVATLEILEEIFNKNMACGQK